MERLVERPFRCRLKLAREHLSFGRRRSAPLWQHLSPERVYTRAGNVSEPIKDVEPQYF